MIVGMRCGRRVARLAGVGAALVLPTAAPSAHAAPASAALSGQVTSPQGAPMAGVLVSATRDGSPITVSVVSQRAGQYSFPASELGPGRYYLDVRAIGYALAGPGDSRPVLWIGSHHSGSITRMEPLN